MNTILNKIQVELKAPKNQFNSFGNYNYRSCEDILEGLKHLLKELKVSLVISDEIVMIGNRYYVKATATLRSDTKEISATAYAREAEDRKGMDLAQITGATSSYARKYALNGLFCIDDVKDADSIASKIKDDREKILKDSPKEQSAIYTGKVITEKQGKRLYAICKSHNVPDEKMRDYLKEVYDIDDSREIPMSVYDDIVKYAENYKSENTNEF